ncbi:MAG: DUF3551 domain-containing protein [Hyphomicrobiales bacterium]|nr:DUF3551 domain-containing protein [Alphaproteobacteria bacterium]
MRKLLLAGLVCAAALLPAPSAEAHEGLWCMRANMGRSVSERCHFMTFEACSAERSLAGSTGFCSQNPRYLPYWQGRGYGAEPNRKVARRVKRRH